MSFNDMMLQLMIGSQVQSPEHFQNGLNMLRNDNIDPFENDYQLLRELRVKRWKHDDCKQLYDAIMKKKNMTRDEMVTLLMDIYKFKTWDDELP